VSPHRFEDPVDRVTRIGHRHAERGVLGGDTETVDGWGGLLVQHRDGPPIASARAPALAPVQATVIVSLTSSRGRVEGPSAWIAGLVTTGLLGRDLRPCRG
jgi:hypothetical protein